jgi:predicted rRNA methylase YqxC with S4 and FtsJ domains
MRERLDKLLVDRGYTPSRESARRLVMAGSVHVGDRVVDKLVR